MADAVPDQRQPDDLGILMNRGSQREAAGDWPAARDAYQQAVAAQPGEPVARLHLAHALERMEQHGEALLAYYRAITDAQQQGRWLDKASTPPVILDRVTHAMRYVKAGRRRAFEMVLAPVLARHGSAALRRFEDCLALHVGERRALPVDPRQKPSFLYFPGLPTAAYFGRPDIPWIESLERQTEAIRAELSAVLPQADRSERVFADDTAERQGLGNDQGAPTWTGFYFYRHGERRDENHALCPRTSAALEALPLVRIREHAPEVMFSVLTPGTHILPHRGVTNTRIVCHLPLVIPDDCALVVGGEMHRWREGRAVVFDDTFEHEAWNRGTQTRVVLIIDVWNPHLTAAEREAVAALVEASGDFNRAAAT
ncbi:MAG: aspartyl/asparaginyl beta-hydroxylase domain-containing protein [Steroidobacteraceae bacterium]